MAYKPFKDSLAEGMAQTTKNVSGIKAPLQNTNSSNNMLGQNVPNSQIQPYQQKNFGGANVPDLGVKQSNNSIGIGDTSGNQIMAATPSWGEIWDQGTGGGEQVPDDIWEGGAYGWDTQDWVNFFQNSDNYNWTQSFWGVLNGMVGSSSPTEILNWASHNFYNQNSEDNPMEDPIEDPIEDPYNPITDSGASIQNMQGQDIITGLINNQKAKRFSSLDEEGLRKAKGFAGYGKMVGR